MRVARYGREGEGPSAVTDHAEDDEGDETVPIQSSDWRLWHADLQHPLLTLEIAQYLRQSRSLSLATYVC